MQDVVCCLLQLGSGRGRLSVATLSQDADDVDLAKSVYSECAPGRFCAAPIERRLTRQVGQLGPSLVSSNWISQVCWRRAQCVRVTRRRAEASLATCTRSAGERQTSGRLLPPHTCHRRRRRALRRRPTLSPDSIADCSIRIAPSMRCLIRLLLLLLSSAAFFLLQLQVTTVDALPVDVLANDDEDTLFDKKTFGGPADSISVFCLLKLCPQESFYYYYDCCEDGCCKRAHFWVLPAAIAGGMFFVGILLGACFLCRS
uniref:Transmembrane protein n=1 Tax=Plectus sambesii TaxID=2011161 RepID=A0A914W0C5_9BILA